MMPSLRKRDKKLAKVKAEALQARKKKLEASIVIEGPKRGAGRKMRQRRVKQAKKQAEVKERIEKGKVQRENRLAAIIHS